MKSVFIVCFFVFCFHLIYGIDTYPKEIYDALTVIARQRTLDKNYFQSCALVGSALAGDITRFNYSDKIADLKLVNIAQRLNENLLKTKNLERLGEGEKFMLRTFDNMLGYYSLLVTSPTREFQNDMHMACSRSSNKIESLIEKFHMCIDMISRSYMERNNYTDASFIEYEEFSRSVAAQVSFCYPICETFLGSSTESTVQNLERMMTNLNDMLLRIDEDRRQNFWKPEFLSYVIEKFIESTKSDQALTDEIQKYFESELSKTDFAFSVFVFNGTHPFVASENVFIYNYADNKNIIIIRTNERKHCNDFDSIESNTEKACVKGDGTKIGKIKNFLTQRCPNALVFVMDDTITNYVFSSSKIKPNAKISNMSWITLLFWEKCLKKVFIAIINQ